MFWFTSRKQRRPQDHSTEADLRVQLEKVTDERNLYENKLKALVLVLADMRVLQKKNDRLKNFTLVQHWSARYLTLGQNWVTAFRRSLLLLLGTVSMKCLQQTRISSRQVLCGASTQLGT